jgi:hypothetical protein
MIPLNCALGLIKTKCIMEKQKIDDSPVSSAKTFEQRIKENAGIWFLGALLMGFGSGFGAYKVIIEVAQLDSVGKGQYVLREELSKNYVSRDDYERLLRTYEALSKFPEIERQGLSERARKTAMLQMQFQMLEKTVQATIDEGKDPNDSTIGEVSPSGVKSYNKAAIAFNELYEDAKLTVFPEDTTPNLVTHPKAIEIKGQIMLALQLLSEPNKQIQPTQ